MQNVQYEQHVLFSMFRQLTILSRVSSLFICSLFGSSNLILSLCPSSLSLKRTCVQKFPETPSNGGQQKNESSEWVTVCVHVYECLIECTDDFVYALVICVCDFCVLVCTCMVLFAQVCIWIAMRMCLCAWVDVCVCVCVWGGVGYSRWSCSPWWSLR